MSGFFRAAAFLYDPRGRCDRKGLLIILAITLSLQIALGFMIWQLGLAFSGPFATTAKFIFVWIALAATSQRLHDIGLSGLWIVAAVIVMVVWWMTGSTIAFALLMAGVIEPTSHILLVLVCAFYLPVLAGVCWLHCVKGQAGDNRYGPVPDESGFSYRNAPDERICESDAVPA